MPSAPSPSNVATASVKEQDSSLAAADSWYVLASILLSILIYFGAACAFHAWYQPPPVDASAFLPESRANVRPEPEERILYLLGLACIPTVPTVLYGVLRWLVGWSVTIMPVLTRPRWLLGRDLAVALAVIGWLFFLAWASEIPRMLSLWAFSFVLLGFIFLSARQWRVFPRAAVGVSFAALLLCSPAFLLLGLFSFIIGRLTLPRVAVGIAVAAMLLYATWLMIVDTGWFASSVFVGHHFDMVLGAVSQVWYGRTVLVDTTSQYGVLYPYIAAWLLTPFGLSVATLSTFFAVLSLLCWGLAYAAVARKTGYASIATSIFMLAFLGVTHAIPCAVLLSMPDCPVYYQYLPLRVIAGIFFIWFVPIYLRVPGIRLLLAGYLAAGLSLLWNSDTGMVVLVAWCGLQVFLAIARWRLGLLRLLGTIAGQGALTAITAALAVGTYMLFARLRSGQFPDLAAFSQYQRIFYVSGFFMLPMKLWEFWQPVILLHAAVVARCLRRAIWKDATADDAWYFFIALFGLGAFSYYQGRSHFQVLNSTFYPAVLLSFLLAYDGWQAIRTRPFAELLTDSRTRWSAGSAGLCSLGFAFGLLCFVRAIPAAAIYALKDPPQQLQKLPQALRRELQGTKGVALMDRGNIRHVMLGTQSALPFASACEVMLICQVQQVQAAIDRDDTRFLLVDKDVGLLCYVRAKGFRPVWRSENLILLERSSR